MKDPRSVAKPGDVVRVKVLEVDAPRKRISLSMRLDDEAAPRPQREQKSVSPQRRDGPPRAAQPAGGALGDALMRAMRESQGKGR